MISMNTLRIRDLFRSDIDPCFALSSSGRKLAYVQEVDGVAQICIAGIDDLTNCVPITKSSRPVFAAPYEPIRWVGGESHIIFTRLEETTFVRYLVNVNSGEEVLIPPRPSNYTFIADLMDTGMNARIAISCDQRGAGTRDFLILSLPDLEEVELISNTANWTNLYFDGQMVPIVYETWTKGGGVEVRAYDQKDALPIRKIAPEDVWGSHVLQASVDGQRLYIVSNTNGDTSALIELDLSSGQESIIFDDPDFDAGQVIFHPKTREPICVNVVKARTQAVPVSPLFADSDAVIRGEFKNGYTLMDLDDDLTKIIVRDDERRLWLVDVCSDRPSLILHEPTLPPFFASEHFWIENNKGHKLLCYLDSEDSVIGQTMRPLVVLLHGGPWIRDVGYPTPEVRWLANRGYLVLRINFSGSNGFGKAILHAGRKQWGGQIIDDIAQATQHVLNTGYVLNQRVAVMGHSFGGYAAFMASVRYPEIFSATLASGLTTDLARIFAIPNWAADREGTKYDLGDPDDPNDFALMRSYSPINSLGKIQSPLFIVTGQNDPSNSPEDCITIVRDALDRGVPATYVCFADEGHAIEDPDSKFYVHHLMEVFLAKHLGGTVEDLTCEKWAPKISVLYGHEHLTKGDQK
jgi:dipeptidyl aminopeptidase/acylaminoacyl peptidase